MKRHLLTAGFVLLSATAAQAQMSANRVRPVGRKLEEKMTIFADPERKKEFAALLPLQYRVVEDDEVNAFAARTQNQIIVNRGLLDFVQNDDELAFILGHEIGHIVVGQMKKVELEQVLEQMADKLKEIEVTENMADELLADAFGVILMDCTGFDTDASVQVVRRFINLRDPATRDILLPWLLDQSKVSADQAHLVEEVRRIAVSNIAEQLREGNKFCGQKQNQSRPQKEVGKPSQRPSGPPKPGPEHQKLAYFAGKWTSEGEAKASEFGPGGKFMGSERCEWFEGHFALTCHSEGNFGEGNFKGLSVMGYDLAEKTYVYFETNSFGENVFSRGKVDGDTWTWNNTATMNGKPVRARFTLKQVSADSAAYKFEMASGDGRLVVVMEGKQTRQK